MKAVWTILGIAFIAGIIALMIPSEQRALPEPLIGVWVTDDPRYEGRSLEFTKVTALFKTGVSTVDTYFITDVEAVPRNEKTFYTITFHRAGEPDEAFSFYYSPKNGGTIQLEHQEQIVWARQKENA